jgi:hypothetical protein
MPRNSRPLVFSFGQTFVLVLLGMVTLPRVEAEVPHMAPHFGKLPLAFERNEGQTDAHVRFISRGPGYSLFVMENEAVLRLRAPQRGPASRQKRGKGTPVRATGEASTLRMRLVGSNPRARASAERLLPGKSNYFVGSDPKQWRTNVPNYEQVRFSKVYPGVDITYYGTQDGKLEYDFVVGPGADPHTITLEFSGATGMRLEPSGELTLQTRAGSLTWKKPVVYQEISGRRREIAGKYVRKSGTQVGFEVAAYDRSRPLIIDPVLEYAWVIGGSSYDYATALAVTGNGGVVIGGSTDSVDFPVTPGAFDRDATVTTTRDGGSYVGDAFVVKIHPSGTAIEWATYLSGSGYQSAEDIAVDSVGNVYLTGSAGADFPTTPGAYRECFGIAPGSSSLTSFGDAYVAKLNPTGSALVYSTCFGGVNIYGNNSTGGLAVDSAGNAYVGGTTSSEFFPTTEGAYQRTLRSPRGSDDAFLAKVNSTGSALVFSTYLGGTGEDRVHDLSVDQDGNIYLAGETSSTDFPQAVKLGQGSGWVGFVAKFNPQASALAYAALLTATPDTSVYEWNNNSVSIYGLAVDALGHAYVTGWVIAADFPVQPGAAQPRYGQHEDAFVAKLNRRGDALLGATYFGGEEWDSGNAVSLDDSGNAWIAGTTTSLAMPTTPGAHQSTYGGGQCQFGACQDAFIARFDSTLTKLQYSSYLGGTKGDYAMAAAVRGGDLFVAGAAGIGFPSTNSAGPLGVTDAFLAKFRVGDIASTCAPPSSPGVNVCTPQDGATVDSPVRLEATAISDRAISHSKVYVDNQVVHAVDSPRVDTSLSLSPGTHLLAVQSWDAAGKVYKLTRTVTVPGSSTGACPAPTTPGINLCSPQNGATVVSPVRVLASGHGGIVHMKVYVDHGERHAVNSNRMDTSLALSAGGHLLIVQGWDSSGNVFKSSATITVSSGGTTGCPPLAADPSVNICAPAQGATVNSPVHISARANSSQLPYHMKVYVDHQIAYSLNADRIEASIPMSAGTRNVVVQAWDNAGRVFKASRTITVSGGTVPTTCNYPSAAGINACSPANGATVGNPVRFWAAARSSSTSTPITAMRVYVDSTATYMVNGDRMDTTLNIPAGVRRITYVAWDSSGKSYTAVVNITVQ